MAKTLVYRLFGWGALPAPMRPVLEQEGIVLLDEGVRGSVTLRNFRAPGKRYSYRSNWFSGSVAITQLRVTGFSFSRPILNLPLEEAKLRELHCSVQRGSKLCIEFDVAAFHEGWSGSTELRFSTPLASLFLERLVAHGARSEPA